MWIFSTTGFYSVVQDRNNPRQMMVRSRSKQHLENLLAKFPDVQTEIHAWTGTDYGFRIFVSKIQWGYMLSHLNREIDYDNFKNAVARENRDRNYLDALHDIWQTMYSYQQRTNK